MSYFFNAYQLCRDSSVGLFARDFIQNSLSDWHATHSPTCGDIADRRASNAPDVFFRCSKILLYPLTHTIATPSNRVGHHFIQQNSNNRSNNNNNSINNNDNDVLQMLKFNYYRICDQSPAISLRPIWKVNVIIRYRSSLTVIFT